VGKKSSLEINLPTKHTKRFENFGGEDRQIYEENPRYLGFLLLERNSGAAGVSGLRVATARQGEDSEQKTTKKTKILFRTGLENLRCLRFLLLERNSLASRVNDTSYN
jgi:hypothetical protein